MESPASPKGARSWSAAIILAPAAISSLLLGAHFLRSANFGATMACCLAPLLLAGRSLWTKRAYQLYMLVAATIWLAAGAELARARIAAGESWLRLALILGAVSALAIASAALFETRPAERWFSLSKDSCRISLLAFVATAVLLSAVQLAVKPPMLLLERFINGGGWLEIGALPAYAAFVAGKLKDAEELPLWRKRIWALFSAAIFLQLLLGLSGVERFLMSGHLHPPVPALIVAAPIFKGGGYFMLALFGSTLLMVGPAWCSYLCYIGSWDLLASSARRRPEHLPGWAKWGRVSTLALVILSSVALRAAGATAHFAAALAIAFGLCGVAVMLLYSRRSGAMVHCTAYCPIGLLSVALGKISPFRIKILGGCSDCGACTKACRYSALSKQDIASRSPGFNCTLCGDCLAKCPDRQIEYRFPGLSSDAARGFFLALAVSIHSAFLGVAML